MRYKWDGQLLGKPHGLVMLVRDSEADSYGK
jgi:hypothetical protein